MKRQAATQSYNKLEYRILTADSRTEGTLGCDNKREEEFTRTAHSRRRVALKRRLTRLSRKHTICSRRASRVRAPRAPCSAPLHITLSPLSLRASRRPCTYVHRLARSRVHMCALEAESARGVHAARVRGGAVVQWASGYFAPPHIRASKLMAPSQLAAAGTEQPRGGTCTGSDRALRSAPPRDPRAWVARRQGTLGCSRPRGRAQRSEAAEWYLERHTRRQERGGV
jgi:hypothetical protein